MNKAFFSIAFILCLSFALSCTAQNSETRNLDNFEGIATSEGIKVTIRKGSKNEARITANGIDLDKVNSEIKSGTLKFDLEGNHRGRVNVEVEVTYTGTLKKASASSAGRLILHDGLKGDGNIRVHCSSAGYVEINDGIQANEVTVKVSSAGKIKIDNVNTNDLNLEASSSGHMTLSGGSTDKLDAQSSSAGHVYCENVKSEDVDAQASSGGGIKLHVDGRFNASASSGGSIKYKGSPSNTNVNKSSGGSVKSM